MKFNSLRFFFPALVSLLWVNAYSSDFVTVQNGDFILRGKPYRFLGTNFWYGAILGSAGEGGDRQRLAAELDSLRALGIDNLRILVGGDGNRSVSCHIEPNLQTAPGVYNPDLLVGLDYLLAELERRDMRAVLYLTNSWEWSGGYGTYLEWTGHGEAPLPSRDGYRTYIDYARNFITDSAATALYHNHVRNIVGRTNSITGRPYSESPAIMSWQICNEPRCFDSNNKAAFEQWIINAGRLIKSIDPNHLISTGSEGENGCEVDIDLWARIHNSDAIDYANIHIWPYNWRWVTDSTLTSQMDQAKQLTADYVTRHRSLTSKPLVLEEFGYPRDSMAISLDSSTRARDDYYDFVFKLLLDSGQLNGVNFWGWGGVAVPQHDTWQPGDPYTGDPAQEPQGLYSVFATDRPTTRIIRQANEALRACPIIYVNAEAVSH
ncbi:MAG: beta-mannosidase [Firmicutes bacterium]|nr:beta-mannosidase [Bacillota bacterium]MCM1401917.1 beta-mannosidase [Bacteroides sp.]MCM1477831.1 beta-mannosidase [Bacteroides sp.]